MIDWCCLWLDHRTTRSREELEPNLFCLMLLNEVESRRKMCHKCTVFYQLSNKFFFLEHDNFRLNNSMPPYPLPSQWINQLPIEIKENDITMLRIFNFKSFLYFFTTWTWLVISIGMYTIYFIFGSSSDLHFFYRQLDFPSEPGVANEILENEPKNCLTVA